MGAACDGWSLGRGRFPPIGGRPGNTAATTLAADSRLTSFSQEQSSLPFQTQNNLNQDGRGSGGEKTEDQWIWSLQSTNKHGGRWGECCMLHVPCFLFMRCKSLVDRHVLHWNEYPTQGWSTSRCKSNPVSTAKLDGSLFPSSSFTLYFDLTLCHLVNHQHKFCSTWHWVICCKSCLKWHLLSHVVRPQRLWEWLGSRWEPGVLCTLLSSAPADSPVEPQTPFPRAAYLSSRQALPPEPQPKPPSPWKPSPIMLRRR